MIHRLPVTEAEISLAKAQIKAFEQIKEGRWRYSGVEAWRGVVCEILVSRWLATHFDITTMAKGLDTSGIYDDYDMIINDKKVEIKSATKNYFKYLMPKIHDVNHKPKDIYIGAKYNETIEPNEVQLLGYITHAEILAFPIKQNMGAPYYEVPIWKLKPIQKNTFD
jgi:hypothetical protein